MSMNTHDYQTIVMTEAQVSALEVWANEGLLTATQVEYIMAQCAVIVSQMKADSQMTDKRESWDRVLRAIATLDRLHEAVKLNHKRVNSKP